ATVLNPYGFLLHVHIWEYLRSDWIRNLVQEFQAPTFRNEGQLQFEFLLILGLVGAGALVLRRKLTEVLWLVFLAHCSLTSVRHAPLYAFVAAPLLAVQLSGWWKMKADSAPPRSFVNLFFRLGEDWAAAFTRTSVWGAILVLT